MSAFFESNKAWLGAEETLARLLADTEACANDDETDVAAGLYYEHRMDMLEMPALTPMQALRKIELAMFSGEAVMSGVDIFALIADAKRLIGGGA